jgi:hypothetical protein
MVTRTCMRSILRLHEDSRLLLLGEINNYIHQHCGSSARCFRDCTGILCAKARDAVLTPTLNLRSHFSTAINASFRSHCHRIGHAIRHSKSVSRCSVSVWWRHSQAGFEMSDLPTLRQVQCSLSVSSMHCETLLEDVHHRIFAQS